MKNKLFMYFDTFNWKKIRPPCLSSSTSFYLIASFIRWKQKPKYHHINYKVVPVILVLVILVWVVLFILVWVVLVILCVLIYHELEHKILNSISNKIELIKYDYGLIVLRYEKENQWMFE